MEFCLNCRQRTNYIESGKFKECPCGMDRQDPSEIAGEIFCNDNVTDQLWATARILTELKKRVNSLERPEEQDD
jgi:hypothetical protein